jgi:hypothetical protein
MYTAERVSEELKLEREEHEKALYLGQPPNWRPNPRTADIYCIGAWLRRRFAANQSMTPERRIQLLIHFNRIVRAELDPYEPAAVVMNLAASGAELEPHYQTYSRAPRPPRVPKKSSNFSK